MISITIEELVACSENFRVPQQWRREIKSKFWDQKLAESQIVKAVNEEPMILVKALVSLLLLATVVAKKRIPEKPSVWKAVKIKAVLSQVAGSKAAGSENWLSDLRRTKPEALRHLREKFEEIGFLEQWEDKFDELLDAIYKGNCITLALAEAVRDVVALYGINLKVSLARRRKGNIKPATSLIRFISPPTVWGS